MSQAQEDGLEALTRCLCIWISTRNQGARKPGGEARHLNCRRGKGWMSLGGIHANYVHTAQYRGFGYLTTTTTVIPRLVSVQRCARRRHGELPIRASHRQNIAPRCRTIPAVPSEHGTNPRLQPFVILAVACGTEGSQMMRQVPGRLWFIGVR
jgi:hypothetical protein